MRAVGGGDGGAVRDIFELLTFGLRAPTVDPVVAAVFQDFGREVLEPRADQVRTIDSHDNRGRRPRPARGHT